MMEIRSRKSLQRTWDEHLHQSQLASKLDGTIADLEAHQAKLRTLLEQANEDHGRALMDRADAVDQAHDYRELVLAACEEMRWPIPETPEEVELHQTGPHQLGPPEPRSLTPVHVPAGQVLVDGDPSPWAEPVSDLPNGKPEWLPPHDGPPTPDPLPDVDQAGAHPLPGGDQPGPGEFHPDPRQADRRHDGPSPDA